MTDKLNKLFTTVLPVNSIKQLLVALGILGGTFMAGAGFTFTFSEWRNIPDEHVEITTRMDRIEQRVDEEVTALRSDLESLERNTNTIICILERQEEGDDRDCRPPLFLPGV